MNTTDVSGSNTTAPSGDLFTVYETAFYMVNGSVGAFFNFLVLFIAFKYIDTDDKPRQVKNEFEELLLGGRRSLQAIQPCDN